MNFPRIASALVFASMIGLSGQSEAGPTFTYGPSAVNGPVTGSAFAVTIPQYDAMLNGPLQNVRFAFTFRTDSPNQIAFENLANQPVRFGFIPYLGLEIKTTKFDSPPFEPFPPSPPFPPFPTPSMPLGAFKGVEDFMGSDSLTVNLTSLTASDTRTYSNFPGLSDFIGTGSVTLNLTAALLIHETSTLAKSLPAYKFLNPGTFSGDLTVTYNYTAVAEPSSLGLLGLAALVGFARRMARRRLSIA